MICLKKILITAVMAAGLLGTTLPKDYLAAVMAAQAGIYVVQEGDSLSQIGEKYGVSVKELRAANHLTGSLIQVGQTLIIPDTAVYAVSPGDNLSDIADRYHTSVQTVMLANGLCSSLIKPGMELLIPHCGNFRLVVDANPALGLENKRLNPNFELNKEEIYLLAKLIHAEARGESIQGQIAVGAVILNRIKNPKFPKTIKEVIFQQTGHVFQFSPVEDGSINLEPDLDAWRAARAAIRGEDPTRGSLFFYNPDIATDRWIKTLPVSTVIGNHVFAR